MKVTQESEGSLRQRRTNTNMTSLDYINQNTRNDHKDLVLSKGSRLSSQKSERELNDYQIKVRKNMYAKNL